MKNLIMWKEGENSFVRWIKKRIDNNLNFLSIFEGPTGIGKSWTALRIAYEIDPEFNPTTQVAFSFSELMSVINKFNREPKNEEDKILYKKKYKVIIFDEAQTSVNKRDWQSRINKLFLYLLSTFRHQNIIVLFTSPFSDFMDSASMKLIHCKFECKGWNKNTKKSHLRPKMLQWNGKMQKFYEHSLYVIKNKKCLKLQNWFVDCPPEHLIQPYEDKKMAFTMKLNAQITRELYEMENGKPDDVPREARKELTEVQVKTLQTMAKHETQQQAAAELGISVSAFNQNLMAAKKKGYRVEEYAENE